MAVSQNGWLVSPSNRIPFRIAGVLFGDVRAGDVFTVLSYVANRFHNEVEHLIPGQCGSYNPRKIPGTNVWSNHASATAIDCNWRLHVLGARHTFTTRQVAVINDIIDECDGVVRWGGTFSNVDEMHLEINAGPDAVHAVAVKLTTPPEQDFDMTPAQSEQLAKDIVDEYLSRVLGHGPETVGVVMQTGILGNSKKIIELLTSIEALLTPPPTA